MEAANELEKSYPQNYFLFSVTIIDTSTNKRKYVDIPVYSHKLVFPNRNVVYNFACQRFGLDIENQAVFDSFAVLSIFQFESKDDYDSYTGLNESETIGSEKDNSEDE